MITKTETEGKKISPNPLLFLFALTKGTGTYVMFIRFMLTWLVLIWHKRESGIAFKNDNCACVRVKLSCFLVHVVQAGFVALFLHKIEHIHVLDAEGLDTKLSNPPVPMPSILRVVPYATWWTGRILWNLFASPLAYFHLCFFFKSAQHRRNIDRSEFRIYYF